MEDQNSQKNQHPNQNNFQFYPQSDRNVDNEEEFSGRYDGNYQNHGNYGEQGSGYDYSELGSQNYEGNLGIVKKRGYSGCVSEAVEECTEGVRRKSSMKSSGENELLRPGLVSTRSALRRDGVGEIVEVEGGHIIRATGRKDRHSKVCTAKGPRDRRVRLAAHTAIQFYDVQDRLGYDRPSKAVDWLIKKAKASIDELEQLPAWSPSSMNMNVSNRRRGKASGVSAVELNEQQSTEQENLYDSNSNSNNEGGGGGSLLPPSLDSDTIKSFFPMGGGTSSAITRPLMNFQDYTHGGGGGVSVGVGGGGGGRQSQDLRLSLQSFQVHDQNLLHSHQHHQQQESVFGGAGPVGYENPNGGWAESQHQPSPEMGRLHRLVVDWQNQNQHHSTNIDQHHHHSNNVGLETGGGGGGSGGGFMFNHPPPLLQPLFGSHHQNQFFTQRGPLQSSNTPSIRAWISDPSIATSSEYLQAIPVHPQGLSGLGFASGGFSGFHMPARIQGDEEHDGELKPSSASSGSRH